MANPIWHSVPGYPDVQVKADGTVRSRRHSKMLTKHGVQTGIRVFPAKVLKQKCVNYPSKHLAVFVNSVRSVVGVHVLMCRAFHGEPPADKPFALHRNGVDHDNRPDNLYWGDRFDNAQDAIKHGVMPRGEKHGLAKLTEALVLEIRKVYVKGCSQFGCQPLARKFKTTPTTIRAVVNFRTWQHVGV